MKFSEWPIITIDVRSYTMYTCVRAGRALLNACLITMDTISLHQTPACMLQYIKLMQGSVSGFWRMCGLNIDMNEVIVRRELNTVSSE